MLFWLQAGSEQEAFSPPEKKILSSPRAICKRTNSKARPPEEEGGWARVTFSLWADAPRRAGGQLGAGRAPGPLGAGG